LQKAFEIGQTDGKQPSPVVRQRIAKRDL